MNSRLSEQVLFTDNEGNKSSLKHIIDDGLDGEYLERIPALVELLDSGSPIHKLLACIVLTSWGCKEGFEAVVLWASNPNDSPWVKSPVSFDRLYGADDAFENLVGALKTSYWKESNSDLVEMQRRYGRIR